MIKRYPSVFSLLVLLTIVLLIIFRSHPIDPINQVGSALNSPPDPQSAKLGFIETTDFRAWQTAYKNAPEASKSSLLHSGIESAKARSKRLKQLIESNPAAALEEVLSLSEYAQLPEPLLPYFEKPVSIYGDIDLRWATYLSTEGAKQCLHENRLYLNDASYTLYGSGRRDAQSPALDLPVFAYVLDDIALIRESPVLPVAGDDLLAAQRLFESAEQGGVDPVTQQPINPEVAAVIGGKLYFFASDTIRDQVAGQIEQAELATLESETHTVKLPFAWLASDTDGDQQGIKEKIFSTNANISVLFIRCNFSDFPDPPVSKADLEADLNIVSGHLKTMSYGTASITHLVTTTLYTATETGLSYALSGDNDALYNEVVAKYDAAPDGNASSTYDVVGIYFPNLSGIANSRIGYGGLGSVGGSRHWVNGVSSSYSRTKVMTHEFGHNYGLYHSNYWNPSQDIGGTYQGTNASSLEYGDSFDNMGLIGDLPEAHFNHYQKNKIDWLPDSKVGDVTVANTYKIYRFDHIDTLDKSTHALRVPMQDDVYYWIGYRQLFTFNTNLMSGAYVVAEGLLSNRPNLIDMTPGSGVDAEADRKDAGLPVGSSFYEADSGVTFETIAAGTDGVGDEWLEISIYFESRFGIIQDTYEALENLGTVSVTVRRQFLEGDITVGYTTSNGTATAGDDYVADSGTLFWANGDASVREITITLNEDSDIEGTETFTITLSDPTPGVLIHSEESVIVTILDYVSELGLVSDSYEYDEAAGVAYVSVERWISSLQSSGSGRLVTVDYATSDGSATAGLDYYATAGTLTWVDGDYSERRIAISIKPDSTVEGIEDFTVTLSNPSSGVVVSGQTTETVLILDPGQRYPSFTPDFFSSSVQTIDFQSDGRAIIGGNISHTSGEFAGAGNIARLNSIGAVDTEFNSSGTGFNSPVEQIIIQSDNSILVRGSFTEYNGIPVPGLVRLDQEGGLDTTFQTNLGTGANSSIYTMALEADGRILVGGDFTDFNGTSTEALIRLNSSGTVNNSLTSPFLNTHWMSEVRAIHTELDGKFMVVGAFYLGSDSVGYRSGIARLNAIGTRDTSFEPGVGLHLDASVRSLSRGYTIVKLPDGYLVGGSFSAYNQNTANQFVRINTDGTFNRAYGTVFDLLPFTMLIEPFGAALIGGSFDTPAEDFLRIKEDWTEDTGFKSSGGPDQPGGSVSALAYAPDGSLWLGGNFFSYNGSSSRPIVRLASGISPYDFWAQRHFTSAQITADEAATDFDADDDGIVNLGEMALSTDPNVADASSVFGSGNLSGLSLVDISGSDYLQMTLDKSALSGGVWYCVQLSSDLRNWTPDPAVPGDETVYDILEDSDSRLVIRDKTAISATAPRFARIAFKAPE